jgi:hypothetical protein
MRSGRVALGRRRPRAPTDPYVRTLAHTVPLMLGSPCDLWTHARTAILRRYGDTCFRVRSLGRSSRPRVQHQISSSVFPSLHRVLRDQFLQKQDNAAAVEVSNNCPQKYPPKETVSLRGAGSSLPEILFTLRDRRIPVRGA